MSVITFWCHSFRHTLTHPLDLESVYKHVLPGSGCPEVTTLHSEVGATVDYIFYSPTRSSTPAQKCMIDNQERSTMGGKKIYTFLFFSPDGDNLVNEGLTLMGSLSLPSEDVLWSMKGLPNYTFPSDHLSLLAKFQMDISSKW